MSTEAVKWAMDDAPMLLTERGKLDTTSRHVLQALAEHAHRDGGGARPSVLRLQYRTGYDRRTVQRALRRLEDGKLITAEGIVRGCTQYRLALNLVRPESDWTVLEAEEEQLREAAAERQRKSRAKRVTSAGDVTVTHSDDVTERPVTHSASVSHALEQRDVTHSDDARHARNAARTIKEPPAEPPENQPLPGLGENLPAVRPPSDAEIDRRPDWLAQLQTAMSASGIDVPWKFAGSEQLLLHNDVQRLGIPRMVRFAVDSAASAAKRPFSSRWFYPGWRQIPTPVDPNVVPLAAGNRQQRETDDVFARAMARAEERDRQEHNA